MGVIKSLDTWPPKKKKEKPEKPKLLKFDTPDIGRSEDNRLDDFSVTSAAYGRPIPLIFGSWRVGGNLIWSSDIIEKKGDYTPDGALENLNEVLDFEIKQINDQLQEVKPGTGAYSKGTTTRGTGGGGGGGGAIVEGGKAYAKKKEKREKLLKRKAEIVARQTEKRERFTKKFTRYTYSASFAVGLCVGEANVTRIWADDQLIYDTTHLTTNVKKNNLRVRVYSGSETQEPDSLLETYNGVDQTPAFRGLCYVVFEGMQLEDYDDKVPDISVEVTASPNDARPLTSTRFSTASEGSVSTGFSTTSLVSDFHRATMYLSDQSNNVLRQINQNSMIEIQQAQYTTDANGNPVTNFSTIVVTEQGYIIATSSGSNSRPINAIDGETLKIISTFGGSSISVGMSPTLFEAVNQEKAATIKVPGIDGMRYFAVLGSIFSSVGVLEATDGLLRYVWDSDTATGQPTPPIGNNGRVVTVVAGGRGPDFAEAYILAAPSTTSPFSSNAYLYKLTLNSNAAYDSGSQNSVGVELDLIATITPSSVVTGADSHRITLMVYDATDDTIILRVDASSSTSSLPSSHYAAKLNPRTGIYPWSTAVPGSAAVYGASQARVVDGVYGEINGSTGWTIDTRTGRIIKSNLTGWMDGTDIPEQFGTGIWDGQSQSFVGTTRTTVARWFFDRGTAEGTVLSLIVGDLTRRAGLPASDVDTTAVSAIRIPGFAVEDQTTVRSVLNTLTRLFQFDLIESDFQLKCQTRVNPPPTVQIPEDKLIFLSENELIEEERTNDRELPVSMSLSYRNRYSDYKEDLHSSQRVLAPIATMHSGKKEEIQAAIALSSDGAKQITEQLLYQGWISRNELKVKISQEFLFLDPGDIVSLFMNDGTFLKMRASKIAVGDDFSIEIEGESADAPYFISTTEAEDGGVLEIQTVLGSPATKTLMLTLTLLKDVDDNQRTSSNLYYFMAGYGQTGWANGALYKSIDNIDYDLTGSVSTEAWWGVTTTALPDNSSPWSTDEETQLVVQMRTGSPLSTVTQLEMLNGANMAAVVRQSDNQPEIIQFRNAVLNANNSITLTGLLRGRRGTDRFTSGHSTGDLFVLLDPSAAGITSLALNERNALRYYRGRTGSTPLDEIDAIKLASPMNDLKPYAPVHLKKTAGTWGSDMTFSWVRRTRVGGELRDGRGDVPVSEDAEAYEIDFLNDDESVVRKVTGLTSPTYTYATALQSTDFPSGFVDRTNLLTNPIFDVPSNGSYTINGWTIESGGSTFRGFTSQDDVTAPQSGTYFLSMSRRSVSTAAIYQFVDIAAFTSSIVAGLFQVQVGAYMASLNGGSDGGRIDIAWLDAGGTVISEHTGTNRIPPSNSAWTQYTEQATAPPTARGMRIILNGVWSGSGARIDTAWDTISLGIQLGTKTSLRMAVYQVSAQVGRGFGLTKEMDVTQ